MKISSILLIIASYAGMIGCAGISQKQYDSINRVAIVNLMDEQVNVSGEGLTVFENTYSNSFKTNSWNIKNHMTEAVKAKLVQDHKSKTFKVINETQAFKDEQSFLKERSKDLAKMGFDTVLIIEKEGFYNPQGGGRYMVRLKDGGFIVFEKSILGLSVRVQACALYSLGLYNTANMKYLTGVKKSKVCAPIDKLELKEADKYDSDEKDRIVVAIKKDIDESTIENISSMMKIKKQ